MSIGSPTYTKVETTYNKTNLPQDNQYKQELNF